MATRRYFWAAGAGLVIAAASCAQIFGVDKTYEQGAGGAGGSTSGTGSTTSSTSGTGGMDAGKQSCFQDTDCTVGNCCSGFCADLTADPLNCGACGAACPSSSMSCSVTGCSSWTGWPMPNPAELADAGLPNPTSYDTSSTAGVVIDKVTHLWWQQPIDTKNTQNATCLTGCTEAQALAYCSHLTLAGHSDWRLPTRIELVSILDYAQTAPPINHVAFTNTPTDYFWTSSLIPGSPDQGFVVYFLYGNTESANGSGTFRVRCVR